MTQQGELTKSENITELLDKLSDAIIHKQFELAVEARRAIYDRIENMEMYTPEEIRMAIAMSDIDFLDSELCDTIIAILRANHQTAMEAKPTITTNEAMLPDCAPGTGWRIWVKP